MFYRHFKDEQGVVCDAKDAMRVSGTRLPMPFISLQDQSFPLKVCLLSAPPNPREIVVANYLTCIEGELIHPDSLKARGVDVDGVFKWVLAGGHTPALESVHLTFGIEKASVVVLKQISRHRIGNSLGVMTQRANSTEYLGNIYDNDHFITPPSIVKDSEVLGMYFELMKFSQKFYRFAIERGIQQDEARYGIPQSAATLWQGTYSYKTILDSICSTRLCHVMQGEMVMLARLMRECVVEYDDLLGGMLMPVCLRSGRCNRNENNPTDAHPMGVCALTRVGDVPVRKRDNTLDLTQYSKDVDSK